MTVFLVTQEQLSLSNLRDAWLNPFTVEISDAARERIELSNRKIAEVLDGVDQVYGVNTGFGLLANVRVSNDELDHLQDNIIRSHAVGVGEYLPDNVVRLIMLMKIKALAEGYSGVSATLVDALCDLINKGIYPLVPKKGSVGASGDLAPLAHMSLALLGEGNVRIDGQEMVATDALAAAGLKPVRLAPKEGLALLNGTQVSTAIALAAAFRTENLFAAALTAGAMSTDAIKGSDSPFDPRIHEIRGHAGQQDVAAMLRKLLEGSDIRASHIDCDRVQDPYSIRCQPQVMGACLDALRQVCSTLTIEASAVTDNPLVFEDDVLSGGNFHAEPVAFAADHLALCIAEIGALSERRVALLVDPHMSRLPAFLVEQSGLNSGFMMVQVVAAALASENKALAHPASVDSLPTSANQEDHVSMATFAASRLHEMIDNVSAIVAIELLSAAQGIDFHRPERSSAVLEVLHARVRELSPHFDSDRSLKTDVDAVFSLIESGAFYPYCNRVLPSA
ncbi:MAG: histidine ammonia-lyase [Pseudomonadota bacterium]|nr:histidine ammonia-lyase [Pseudomonadota bacterium]